MNVDGNPYVGPRTFLKEEGHLFFGRDREARDLSAIVAYDKCVLFYAQSGAGKSSLINTRLIPYLEGQLYEVLPVARVSGNWPKGPESPNIYIYNLIRSLIQHEVESDSLINLSLSQFLAKLNEEENGYFYDVKLPTNIRSGQEFEPWRRALIIDQFEELFSTHPEAWGKREDFFIQIAQAMKDDPYLWVVFVMREDYIAALDPYAHLLSNKLRTRYYMQRLSREAAINAVRKPVETLRPYDAGVAEQLVDDLSSIKIQKPDGTPDTKPGQYVEPVQLQVVCYGLWQNLPKGTSITKKDLQDVGDVDEALGKYYAGRVAEVAEKKNVKERFIRDWIERKLIAPGGIRNMVLQEKNDRTSGMDNDVIQALQSDLIRGEDRGGTIWYELTHDRLVGPILENNKEWFDKNLSPLQRQATLWNNQERNENWLLRDQALVEVEEWAKANPDEVTNLEEEFLEACLAKQAEEQEKQQREAERKELESAKILMEEQGRTAEAERKELATTKKLVKRSRLFTIVAVTLMIIAVFLATLAFRSLQASFISAQEARVAQATAQSGEGTARAASDLAIENAFIAGTAQADAQAQANKALSGNLAAQADASKNSNYVLALLLGMEAYQRDSNLLTRTTLFQLLQFTPYKRHFGFTGPVSSVAVSPDGAVIAVASSATTCLSDSQCKSGEISLFDADLNRKGTIPGDYGIVKGLAFHDYPDQGLVLAAGGCVPEGCAVDKGQITFWNLSNPQEPKLLSDTSTLKLDTGYTHTNLVKTVAFSPDGNWLASGSFDTTIIIWDIRKLTSPSFNVKFGRRHSSFVNGLAFSPDANTTTLVSAGDDKHIWFWNFSRKNGDAREAPSLHKAPINSIAFSPDGTRFASAADDNVIFLWDWDGKQGILRKDPKRLEGHTGYIKSIAFNADGIILASAGFDNSIILWNVSTGQQIGPSLTGHSGAINSLAFGTKDIEGQKLPYLISGSDDHTVIRWDLSNRQHLSEAVATLPDGVVQRSLSDRLEVQRDGQQINVQEKTTGTTISLRGHSGSVKSLTFSPQPLNGIDLLASAGEDQTVILWDVTDISTTTEREFLRLGGYDNPVKDIYFSPDGKYLYTVETIGESKHITKWNIDPDRWSRDLACAAVNQHFVPQETLDEFLERVPGRLTLKMCDIQLAAVP
jgi:WD40 repeat protein